MFLGFDRLPALEECCCNQPTGLPERSSCHSNLFQGVAESTSQLLTHADLNQAIEISLTTLGQVTGVDRVYIFEIHAHPETGEPAISQRFEWVQTAITPQIDDPAWQNRTNANGMTSWQVMLEAGQSLGGLVRGLAIDPQDDLALQDILSILIVPIQIGGKLWGFIGFDDCHTERQWSRDEEAVLQMMAASIGGAIARRQTEAALHQSESRLQKIAANVPGMIYQFVCRANGSCEALYASSGCRELLELEPETIQANIDVVAELCHPDDRLSFEQSIAASDGLQSWNWEGRMITPSGQLKWVQGFSRPELQPNGDLLWDGVMVDITERKQTEEECRQSEARYRAMLDASPDLMFRLNRQGQYLDFKDDSRVELLREAIVGHWLDELLPPEVADLSLQTIQRTLDTETLQTCEYQLSSSVGLRHYEARLVVSGPDEVLAIVQDVTDRKRVEAELRDSQERLQSFFNATFEAVIIHNFNQILDVNPASEALFGYAAKQMIGMSVLHLVADVSLKTVQSQWRSLTSPDQPYEYEGWGQRQDGSRFMGSVRSKMIDYRNQKVWVSSIRDITERHIAEAALRLSEEKFSKAFQSSPNSMTIATLETGRLIEVNESFLQATGYQRQEVTGRTVHELGIWANPADRDRMTRLLRQHGTVHNLECQFRHRSGYLFTTLFSAEAISIEGELCLIDVGVDISERLRAEQQLWAAAERDRLLGEIALRIRQSLDLEEILNTTVAEVRQFLQSDRVCVIQADHQGRGQMLAESADPKWQLNLGPITASKQQLQEFHAIFGEGHPHVVADVAQLTQYPEIAAHHAEYQIRASLGVPLMLNNQTFGLLVADQCSAPRQWEQFEVDLLERLATQVSIAIQQAQLYRQVQDLNAGLEQQVAERTAQLQQKMEELQELNQLKDEFLNAFSHDLRTPVMGMSLVIKNLLNQSGEAIPVMRSILDRMMQSSEHQLQLLNALLQAYSGDAHGVILHHELVQLSLLTQIIVEDLEPLIEKNQVMFENHVPPDLPLVKADPTQLRRVFENLITNALHHNPPQIHLALGAAVQEGMIRFTLQDNGVGIPPETRDRLFNRYVRGTKSRHFSGIGLGLYLCRQIITAHGGQIGVNSVPGEGSTFWLTLPLAIASAPPNLESFTHSLSPTLKTKS